MDEKKADRVQVPKVHTNYIDFNLIAWEMSKEKDRVRYQELLKEKEYDFLLLLFLLQQEKNKVNGEEIEINWGKQE